MKSSQIMLIGFDLDTSQRVADILSEFAFEVHVRDEPFDGLADLIEDPGVWMACVIDAHAFTTDAAFQRYLQLFAFEGQDIGMILGDANRDAVARYQGGNVKGVDGAIGNATDPQQILGAMESVLARRGFGRFEFAAVPETAPALAAPKAPAVISTPARATRVAIRHSTRNRHLPRGCQFPSQAASI